MPLCSQYAWLRQTPVLLLRRPIARHFSCTATRAAPTYYDILGVPVTATKDQIKKQFYALSLAHHPDRNKDPGAADKFSDISSAYHVLANPAKRARYDRENDIRLPSSTPRPAGSFSSASAGGSGGPGQVFGSRPASGLSKRRGAFRGPPPSFYENGGYGGTERRGHEAHEEPRREHWEYYGSAVPHFDARSHRRTQSHQDARRRMRRVRVMEEVRERAAAEGRVGDDVGGYDGGGMVVRFLIVSGILVVGVVAASFGRTAEKKRE